MPAYEPGYFKTLKCNAYESVVKHGVAKILHFNSCVVTPISIFFQTTSHDWPIYFLPVGKEKNINLPDKPVKRLLL